jgi:hypothetical protein
MSSQQTEKTQYVIIRDKDGNEFSFDEEGLRIIRDQVMFGVLKDIRDELRVIKNIMKMVHEMPDFNEKEIN